MCAKPTWQPRRHHHPAPVKARQLPASQHSPRRPSPICNRCFDEVPLKSCGTAARTPLQEQQKCPHAGVLQHDKLCKRVVAAPTALWPSAENEPHSEVTDEFASPKHRRILHVRRPAGRVRKPSSLTPPQTPSGPSNSPTVRTTPDSSFSDSQSACTLWSCPSRKCPVLRHRQVNDQPAAETRVGGCTQSHAIGCHSMTPKI